MSKIMMFVRHLQRAARNAVRSVNKIDSIPRKTTTIRTPSLAVARSKAGKVRLHTEVSGLFYTDSSSRVSAA